MTAAEAILAATEHPDRFTRTTAQRALTAPHTPNSVRRAADRWLAEHDRD